MDAIELLKKDHRNVESLFQRFNGGGGITGAVKRLAGTAGSPSERRSIAEKICAELDVHARIEEQVFYPAVRALRDHRLSELVSESTQEHATIKQRVAETRRSMDDEDGLQTAVDSLQECVDHHVREEENEMFPLLEERMPTARREELGRELAAHKRERPAAGGRQRTSTSRARSRKTTKRASASSSKPRTRKTVARSRKSASGGRKRATGGRRR